MTFVSIIITNDMEKSFSAMETSANKMVTNFTIKFS